MWQCKGTGGSASRFITNLFSLGKQEIHSPGKLLFPQGMLLVCLGRTTYQQEGQREGSPPMRSAEEESEIEMTNAGSNSTTFPQEQRARLKQEGSMWISVSKATLEEHLKKACTDDRYQEEIMLPPDMSPLSPPVHQLDTCLSRWIEVEKTACRARAGAAPGPNGLPYRLYKNANDFLRIHWKLMKVVWDKKEIPTAWRWAGGIIIPKEKDSSEISQLHQISLRTLKEKSSSVWSLRDWQDTCKRMSDYQLI